MGTRSITYVYEGGKCRLSMYTHFDSSFEDLGVKLLEFLSNKKNVKHLRKALLNCEQITKEKIEAWKASHPTDRDWLDGYVDAHPEFLYGDAADNLEDIVFCDGDCSVEYTEGDMRYEDCGYVIDLDKMTFEAYTGMNKKPLREDERFYDGLGPDESGYYPLRECGVFDIKDLPSSKKFVKKCCKNE